MKQASKSVYIMCSNSWSLVYYSINFVCYKDTDDPDDTELTDEDNQVKYFSH
jgi:hypothetical protein